MALDEEFEVAPEGHTRGKAVCYPGDIQSCGKVVVVLGEIKLKAAIDRYARR